MGTGCPRHDESEGGLPVGCGCCGCACRLGMVGGKGCPAGYRPCPVNWLAKGTPRHPTPRIHVQGQLFTHYFLTDGIRTTPEWKAAVDDPQEFESFRQGVSDAFASFSSYSQPNEATTEQGLIRPVLELLGWTSYLPQQGSARNEDIPDYLLFEDEMAIARAAGLSRAPPATRQVRLARNRQTGSRTRCSSKRASVMACSLESRDKEDAVQASSPHGQILRYLATAGITTDDRIRWGILTNGETWRLYDNRTRPRSSAYYEFDVPAFLDDDHQDELRTFFLLFRRQAFTKDEGATTTFVETALAEGRRYEERVAQDLSGVVFREIYPSLVSALAEKSDAPLNEVRDAALIFLYRLLFVLYAEDRGLLPVNNARYNFYSMRVRVRDKVAEGMAAHGGGFSHKFTIFYDHLAGLFRQIGHGDPSIGLPPYNGGLFSAEAAPLLETARLTDSVVAPIVYGLSHTNGANPDGPAGRPRFVNYRDMSVQQLGSIYERLMEREPVREDDGTITVRPNPYARKDSGSFYTPQELVDLIIDQTLKPLAEERLRAFEDKAKELKSDRRPKAQRREDLQKLDPAEAVLELKVLDPAMGSGHFLVSAVDFLSDYISDLLEYTAEVPDWLNGGYESPLVARIAAIREDIVEAGHGIALDHGRVATHRPGHHPAHGAQAVHLRRGQEPADSGTRQGVAMAAQLHRRRSAFVPRPPPALRRFAHRPAGFGGQQVSERVGRTVRQQRHRRRRVFGEFDARHRSYVRRRRDGGAGVGHPVRKGRGGHLGPARIARFRLRPAVADGGNEGEGAQRVRSAIGRGAEPGPRKHVRLTGQRVERRLIFIDPGLQVNLG